MVQNLILHYDIARNQFYFSNGKQISYQYQWFDFNFSIWWYQFDSKSNFLISYFFLKNPKNSFILFHIFIYLNIRWLNYVLSYYNLKLTLRLHVLPNKCAQLLNCLYFKLNKKSRKTTKIWKMAVIRWTLNNEILNTN